MIFALHFPIGSTVWLLANELRLAWRGARQGARARRRAYVLGGVFMATMILFGVPLGWVLRHSVVDITPVNAIISDALLTSLLTLMLAASLASAVEAFYSRGDLDLLLSSPIAPQKILIVRAVVIAVNLFIGSAVLITPLFLPVALFGHSHWLYGYLVLFAMALTATALGLMLAVVMLRLIGPRRTRATAQIMAAVIGAAIFLFTQIRYLMTNEQAGLAAQLIIQVSHSRWAVPQVFAVPLMAMSGDPGSLTVLLAIGAALLAGACLLAGPGFAASAAAASGAGLVTARRSRPPRRFIGGAFAATVRKELRLMGRDLPLISDVVLKLLYLVPLTFMALRGAASHATWSMPTVVMAMTFMAGQVAGSLAWITLSAEDAPELIAAAPTTLVRLRRAKLAAALLPLWVVLAPALFLLSLTSPIAGFAAAVGCVFSTVCGGLVNDWYQRPAKRSEFRMKRSGSFTIGLAEILVGGLIAGTAALAARPSKLALIPAFLAALALLFMQRNDRQVDESLDAAWGGNGPKASAL